MPTGTTGQNRDSTSDLPVGKRVKTGRRALATALPLLAVVIAVLFAITPLRETLSRAQSGRPSPERIRAQLETALDQVYRSFELDDEVATYDRIAESVTGDATREIYLEVRRSLLVEDGGGVSIDEVRLDDLDEFQWQPDGGCQVQASWVVRGTVGHFGHQHERQNRYRARIKMHAEAGAWKIRSVQITEQEREK